MKKINIWFVIIVLLSLSNLGCQKVLFTYYGIKKPKIEQTSSIQKFIDKNNLQSGKHVTLSFEGFISRINDIGLPGIEIYTKDGKYIPYPGEESCKVGASEFVEVLDNPLQFPTSDSLDLHDLTKDLRTVEGNALTHDEQVNFTSDYVVVIYWATFVGKLNSRDIEGWKQNIANNPSSSFDVLMVNCDLQEWWDKEEELEKMGKKK